MPAESVNMLVNIAGVTFKNPVTVASGTFGFKTGEGLVNKFRGKGKILIQSRNVEALAQSIIPFIPSKG